MKAKALLASEARRLTREARFRLQTKASSKAAQQQKEDARLFKALLEQAYAAIRQAAKEGKNTACIYIMNARFYPQSEENKAPEWVHKAQHVIECSGFESLVLRNHQQMCFALSISWAG